MGDYVNTLSSQVLNLEDTIKSLTKECETYKNMCEKYTTKINKLNIELSSERMKSAILANLLEKNTSIKFSDVFELDPQSIAINCNGDKELLLIVKNYAGKKEEQKIALSTKKKKSVKMGEHFRKARGVEMVEENTEQKNEQIRDIEKRIEELAEENSLDVSQTEILDNMQTCIEKLKERLDKGTLSTLKTWRNKLIKLPLVEYTKIISENIKELERILKSKKYDTKKIHSTITESLSPLEQRLVFYGKYYDSALDPDEIQKLETSMVINNPINKKYTPFVPVDLYEKIHNYTIAIFSIKKILKKVMFASYCFNSIGYLSVPKSDPEDLHSFYILEKIVDGKRHWRIDYRLENFSKSLSDRIKSYCIGLFRRIYKDIFNDNIFREDFRDKAPILSQDCTQLITNLVLVSKPKEFCDMLRKLTIKFSTLQQTNKDAFNFTADDKLHKRNYAALVDKDEDIVFTLKLLFDKIGDEDAEKLLMSFS